MVHSFTHIQASLANEQQSIQAAFLLGILKDSLGTHFCPKASSFPFAKISKLLCCYYGKTVDTQSCFSFPPVGKVAVKILLCCQEVSGVWMRVNELRLNLDKLEVLIWILLNPQLNHVAPVARICSGFRNPVCSVVSILSHLPVSPSPIFFPRKVVLHIFFSTGETPLCSLH